jgi:hypothetical protein
VHKTPDAIFQVDNIEVYKQSNGFATKLQVRKYLGLMTGATWLMVLGSEMSNMNSAHKNSRVSGIASVAWKSSLYVTTPTK